MSDISDLKDEIRRLREEVQLLRLSQPRPAYYYPSYIPYYVPVGPYYTPPTYPYSQALQGNACGQMGGQLNAGQNLLNNGYAA